MMSHALDAGSDTEYMWGLLQIKCPLLTPEERAAQVDRVASMLENVEAPVLGMVPPVPAIRERRVIAIPPSRFCLMLPGGHHRIALPRNGDLVLGRFDPLVNTTPDVDLTWVNQGRMLISRRHARIVGQDDEHAVEDIGSTYGTLINWMKIGIGRKVKLQPGDRVILGQCELVYSPMAQMQLLSHSAPLRAYLWATFTGRRYPLSASQGFVVGRGDRAIGMLPDIDLGREGEPARSVSRRHIRIDVHNNRHYVEDLGSGAGTRVNGEPLPLGKFRLLNPGDHLWLGGFVLAYDLELPFGRERYA
jgi:pSer/pThr/pTyr-binding forkhead associated (FHA) protein